MSELAARLSGFLSVVEPGRGAEVTRCEAITGGYSRATSRATVAFDDGARHSFILRADPPEGTGVFVSDRDAEWRLLRALPNACPVATPTARWYDASGAAFGTKCIVMDAVEATSLQVLLSPDPAAGDALQSELFVDTIAAVHSTPLDELPFTTPDNWDAYLDRILDGYRRLGRRHPTVAPVLRYVTSWADAHRPPPVPLGLVHGDCQPSNVLIDRAGSPMVIDWEFAHIGDPREDLGYYTQIPLDPNVYWRDPEAFLARYRDRTGLTQEQINPATVDYFLIIGMASLYAQMVEAAATVGDERRRPGPLATFLVNAISHQHDMFLAICDRLN